MSERLVPVDELVTVDDIAKRLKMSVNSVSNIVKGRDGRYKIKFPKPLVGRGTRAVWQWTEVATWYESVAPNTVKARRQQANAAAMDYRRHWCRGNRTA